MDIAVIPALDEERAIGSVVLKTRGHVDEVIVVDDGSSDATAEIARDAGATVVAHERSEGKGRALATGIQTASEVGAERVVLLDGDGQHDPAEIPTLLDALAAEDADLVVGSRTRSGDGDASRTRRTGRRVLDAVTNLAGGTNLADTQSGFRAGRPEALTRIAPREDGMGAESEMLLAASREKFDVAEVAIADHYPEDVDPSTPPARHGASVVASILRFVREEHPLAFFGGGGLVSIAIGLWLGYETVSLYYGAGVFAPGDAMLTMLFILLGSIGLLGGLILDAIRLQLRGR